MRNRVLPRFPNRSIQPPIQNRIEIGISHCGNLQCLKNSRIVVQNVLLPPHVLRRYHNAPRTQSGWQSVPLIVRLAVYAISAMVLLSFGFWLLMVLAIFGKSHR